MFSFCPPKLYTDFLKRLPCPYRFHEHGQILQWIGKTLLDHPAPRVATEVGFLVREPLDPSVVLASSGDPASSQPASREPPQDASAPQTNDVIDLDGTSEDVGRIDSVLVHPDQDPLLWCALEIQAVYFSGRSMSGDFAAIQKHRDNSLPFPSGNRHPDYRSSGPKRLMPQLQIKVPTLRRWGKKMAVLVDQDFFHALGKMDNVTHRSNCDIAWFIVRFDESETDARLVPHEVRLTTLERAVEGLTSGRPVDLDKFESRIRAKLS